MAFTSETDRPDVDWSKTLTVKAFALIEGQAARTTIVDTQGKSLGEVTVTKKAGKYEVTAPAAVLPFTLEMGGKTYKVEKTSQIF